MNKNINKMLTGLVINGEQVGLNISDLGVQRDMLVKGTDGKNYEVNFTNDGTRMYDIADEYANGQFSAPTSSVDGYTSETGGSYITNMLKINSFFMCDSDTVNEADAPAATHNYVELSNSLRKDISLNSVILMYLEKDSTNWKYIKLKGHIPAHGTYLIRGAQVGYPSNETVNVDSYDIEWYDGDNLISFNSTVGGTFYLCASNNGKIYDSEGAEIDPQSLNTKSSPYNSTKKLKGYIDCVGIGPTAPFGEGNGIALNTGEKLYKCITHRMYGEDTCSKVNKGWEKRKTTTFFTYCNMELYDSDSQPYWSQIMKQRLAPKASYLHKNFLDDKSALREDQPNCINQTFGIQGSETTAGANDATRCFTWVSVGYYDEYIEYKKSDDTVWKKLYSIDVKDYDKDDGMHYSGDLSIKYFMRNYPSIYSRMKWVSTGQRLNVTHRAIIKNLGSGVYDYRVGRDGDNRYTSSIRQFIVSDASKDFTFVQTTDQQDYGFHGYAAWKKSACAIGNHKWTDDSGEGSLDFTINTGDMSQNGNRENEWVDYYNGKCAGGLQDIPEMPVIGNNDLGSEYFYTLNDDGTKSVIPKTNSMTVWCWYTFELDADNPPVFRFKPDPDSGNSVDESKVGPWVLDYSGDYITYFIPSLYSFNYGNYHFTALNSEFATNSAVYRLYYNDTNLEVNFKGAAYYCMYCWAAKDLNDHINSSQIVYAHEIPFCIAKGTAANTTVSRTANNEGMSKLNFDFSPYISYAGFERYVYDSGYDSYAEPENSSSIYQDFNYEGTEWQVYAFVGGCCFSELFQNTGVKLCLGGHKHSYCLSLPLIENVNYTYTDASGVEGLTSNSLKTVLKNIVDPDYTEDPENPDSGVQYIGSISARLVSPNSPILCVGGSCFVRGMNTSQSSGYSTTSVSIPSTDKVNMTPVTYCMCQATGYKLSSNNDKPGQWVNWLKEYFPYDFQNDKVNSGQTWPMCNGAKCTADGGILSLTSYRVVGVTADSNNSTPSTFNINKLRNITPTLATFVGAKDGGSLGGDCSTEITFDYGSSTWNPVTPAPKA